MIAAVQTADNEWSEKKMEGEDGLIRTVESLRGRLQAERAASRAAKKDAELMNDKLKELEHQLRLEMKARKREEKRLQVLRKKLESLNIGFGPGNSQESSERSSISGSSYCISSTASTGFKDPEEQGEKWSKSADDSGSKVADSENVEETEGEDRSSGSEGVMSRKMMDLEVEEDSCSKSSKCRPSDEEQTNPSQKSVDSSSDDHSLGSASVTEMGNNEDEDYVDNTMAMVPVIKSEETERTSISKETNHPSGNVREVLDTLKQIRERLQSSIGDRRRHMIRVG